MNKVILIGNLTRDPELRTTQSGISMCRLTVACNRRVPNAQGVREADFIPVVAWRERAEFISRYFTKGRKIAVEGSLQIRSYEAQDGTKRTAAEVVAENVEFVDSRQSGESQGYGQQGGYQGDGGYAPARQAEPSGRSQSDDFMQVDDDELPF